MQQKIIVQRLPLMSNIIVSIVAVALLVLPTSGVSTHSFSEGTPVSEAGAPTFPVRLMIPSINVDDFVEYVGRTPTGAMDVPKNPANVAWYMLGPKPNAVGSAVIAGHSGWANGKPAAFDHLYKLKKGDKVYIKDDKGIVSTFVVRETRNYDPTADTEGVFTSDDGGVHLNLITCGGVWDPVAQASPNRLVVFTDKE